MRGLEWDPFCGNNLATGGGDGMVKVWSIPAGGLSEDLTAPMVSINTGQDAFHDVDDNDGEEICDDDDNDDEDIDDDDSDDDDDNDVVLTLP